MEEPVAPLGAHVYRWSTPDQVRLLRDGLRPAAREARSRGLTSRFWYTLFDARGPHVFALFAAADRSRRRELADFLGDRLAGWLAAHPSAAPLDRDEVERRHAACRGKVLAAIDAEAGLAANDSLHLFEHPAGGYPFATAAGIVRPHELWRRLDPLALWALDHVGEAASAVRLAAVVDHALGAAGVSAAGFWRYVATTLLVPLGERLASDEAGVVAALPAMVGERNTLAFGRLWSAVPHGDDPPAAAAVRLVVEDGRRPLEHRFRLLREIVHVALAQLLQGVQARIPLVLYAWHRNLSRASAA
jgi:hypothetical protein